MLTDVDAVALLLRAKPATDLDRLLESSGVPAVRARVGRAHRRRAATGRAVLWVVSGSWGRYPLSWRAWVGGAEGGGGLAGCARRRVLCALTRGVRLWQMNEREMYLLQSMLAMDSL